ncbi:metal ABC transporter substrate-binding protein [Metabacillus sp. RGM 3146]|uniref:metal ABC transporter substrate-binding protein n=1 Tax=Metabacillus sp. RGM 3146 TaxID=3401092 RepID=UPI003B9C4C67
MKKWSGAYAGLFLVLAFLLSGCVSNETAQTSANKQNGLHIVTTFYPMYDFSKNVTGKHGQVDVLVPAGTEPHEFEPTPKDVAKIQNADVFVYNSDAMETWVPKLLKSIDTSKVKVVNASEGIKLMEGISEEEHASHEEQTLDPHVWLDPVLAQKEVNTIGKAIRESDPAHKQDYIKNEDQYISELKQLDQQFRSVTEKAPRKEFVTQHAAFGYLAKQYGLTQIPIAGLSPDQEPSPAKMGELQKYIKSKGFKIIYFEEVASPKVAETLASETGAKTVVLSPIEGITKEEQDKGEDYIGYMQKNLEALKQTILEK